MRDFRLKLYDDNEAVVFDQVVRAVETVPRGTGDGILTVESADDINTYYDKHGPLRAEWVEA